MTLVDPDLLSGRLFFGVPVPAPARGPLEDAVAELRRLVPEAAFTLPAGWHVTLAFLGQVRPELADLVVGVGEQVAAGGTAVRLRLAGAGAFPGTGRARVLWAGLDGDLEPLGALARELHDACLVAGLRTEERAFQAHLTLARLRTPARVATEALRLAADAAGACPPWRADALCCFRSRLTRQGARYEVLRRFPLGS